MRHGGRLRAAQGWWAGVRCAVTVTVACACAVVTATRKRAARIPLIDLCRTQHRVQPRGPSLAPCSLPCSMSAAAVPSWLVLPVAAWPTLGARRLRDASASISLCVCAFAANLTRVCGGAPCQVALQCIIVRFYCVTCWRGP